MSEWQQAIKKSKHYLAVGQTKIWLHDGPDSERPWAIVSSVESGALHRFSTSVSLSFEALHPCGLTFHWSVDMEPRSANGTGHFQIDVTALRGIAKRLPLAQRVKFQDIISACAEHVSKQAKEYQETADKLYGCSAQMREVVQP